MDGVRRTLALLSTLVVVSSVALNDQGRRRGVVWYPSLIPGVPRLPRYQTLPRQTLVVPATIHVQWLQNGSHFRVGIVPESSRNERCSHSSRNGQLPHHSQGEQLPHHSQDEQLPHYSQDEQLPHYSQDEQLPHHSQDEQLPHYSQDEQLPHFSQDEQLPHYSQDEQLPHHSQDGQLPHYSQDEQLPHYSQDEQLPHHSQDGQLPHYSQDEQLPHFSQDEQLPHYSQDEQLPHYSQDEQLPHHSQDGQLPHYSQDEQLPHFSQDEQLPHHSQEQHPHSSQDDQHPLKLFSSEEYDLTIAPPALRGYDQLTTILSVFDDSNHLLPVQHHDLSKLSFAAKERLKSAGTLEEVLQVPGFPALLQEDQEEPVTWTLDDPGTHRSSRMYRPRGEGGAGGGARARMRRPAVVYASSSECDVERVSVRLKAPPGSRLIPSCVRLGKCGGCCAPGRVCNPTRINTLSVMVLQLSTNLRESRSVRRKVEEAAECRCECQVRATDCDVTTQEYDQDSCECVCKSSLAEEQARCEASPKHQWNQLRCACVCANVRSRECSSGHTFYEDSCRCETTREE